MKNKKSTLNKKFIITIVVALLVGFVALVIRNYNTKTSFKYGKQAPQEVATEAQDEVNAAVNKDAAEPAVAKRDDKLLLVKDSELVYGDRKAPVVMIEYASLSCPHCAMFYREAFEKLKAEYIDAGKVQFVYRDFPLNQQALVAAMVAECRAKDEGNSSEKYYGLIKALFKTQDSWAFDPKYAEKLESIAKLDGMSGERFKSCIEDQKLQGKILQARMEAAKSLQLHSTPTFFIGGEISEGYVDYLSLKKIIDKKLSEVK